jgi:hypothetical protein
MKGVLPLDAWEAALVLWGCGQINAAPEGDQLLGA